MRFGTVQGVLVQTPAGWRFTVMLLIREGGSVVRDDPVPDHLVGEDPAWLIDQLVQETLGNELAEEGWEVIAISDDSPVDSGQSRLYSVRNLI